MITSEELYKKCKKLCIDHNTSLGKLAEDNGYTSNYFYVFKHNGKGLNTLEFWSNVAKTFGMTLDELLKG